MGEPDKGTKEILIKIATQHPELNTHIPYVPAQLQK